MSNPRYRPRDFLQHPEDFGRRLQTEWIRPTPEQATRDRGQRVAASIQHRISYGILKSWMPSSKTKKMTTLAQALEMPYSRLQRMLTGHTVMQFEDLGRLYAHVGPQLEPWLLTGDNAKTFNLGAATADQRRTLDARRAGQAGRDVIR